MLQVTALIIKVFFAVQHSCGRGQGGSQGSAKQGVFSQDLPHVKTSDSCNIDYNIYKLMAEDSCQQLCSAPGRFGASTHPCN